MKLGIISDVHGNLDAITAVFNFFDAQGIERVINCGDIIGYGAQPNECIGLLRGFESAHSIIGNHDYAALYSRGEARFNSLAHKAIKWTRQQLSSENVEYLTGLEKTSIPDGFMMTHGSPRNPLYEYIINISQAITNLDEITESICFIGHTHMPACYWRDNEGRTEEKVFNEDKPVEIQTGYKYLINAGSVGQPRDGNPLACACIYNMEENRVVMHRVKYDIKSAQKKILDAGLPEFLATRLERGT